MKKSFLFIILFTIINISAFSQAVFGVSAGAGASFSSSYSNFKFSNLFPADEKDVLNTKSAGGGVNAFFDLTYVEFFLGTTFGNLKNYKGESFNTFSLHLGLLAKYPIEITYDFLLFPMFGIDYEAVLSRRDKNGENLTYPIGNNASYESEGSEESEESQFNEVPAKKALNALWMKFGLGMDIYIAEYIFLRPEFLYGFRFKNTYEKFMVKSLGAYLTSIFNHGFDIKFTVGFLLY
ncbi:MAG: hypothetical protein Ta2F_15630 [Termitinemataceae bacterium]|nr:MAG: hypothetical protein Ta2F_15630 [Termitinemataceae bacterium]